MTCVKTLHFIRAFMQSIVRLHLLHSRSEILVMMSPKSVDFAAKYAISLMASHELGGNVQ